MKKRLTMPRNWPKVALMFALVGIFGSSFAQNLAQHHWYFGTTVNGVQFNRSTNIPQLVTDQHILAGTGGSAVATDPSNANLLFYSDGVNVYNSVHVQMPQGSGLSGNPNGNQPVVFCPIPGQPDKYFLFTNSANYTTGGGISWSVVDMKLYGTEVFPSPPLGNVDAVTVAKNNPIASLTGRSEGMTIVPHSNGTDYWLITHKNGAQEFDATKIDASSYPAGTFTTSATNFPTLPATSVANFAYNHRNKKIAVSSQDPNTDAIILNFDPSTGQFTFDRTIFNTGVAATTNQSVYDIEWDNKGQYLYISRAGETGINADVLQYDYLNPTNTLQSILGGSSIFRSWGLIFAPDSTIYHLYQTASGGPYLMENFSQTNHRADSVIRTPLPFGNVDFGGAQFPQFNTGSNPNLTVSFTTIGSCQNNPTSFFPTVSPNADSLNWNFGETPPSKVTEWSPVHTYATAGTFNVTLTAYYQGQKKTVTQPVTINAMTLKIQLVSDTTACRSEFPPPRGSSSPKQFSVTVKVTQGSAGTYKWSNGQTGATLKPDSAGYYYVVVSDASAPGCSAYAGVNVKEYKLQDQRSNVWYFGNTAGIDFNKRPPKALSNSIMDAPAGCAIICDRNGQTIFYTDGNTVYGYDVATKTSSVIDTVIGGDPNSSQSAIIIPVPGDETLYYIFTTQAINGTSANELRYSLFDLKQGTRGQVVQKNILLFSKSSEHLTANSQWLIAHEYGNNTFRAYKVSAAGIADPVYSSIGSVESFTNAANGQGYMKLGPKNNLAVTFSTPGTSNWVELFTFVDTTGVITNYRKIDLKQPTGQVYGVEFSPGGNKVFASVKDTPTSTVYEYFLDSLGGPHFRNSTLEPAEVGALQLAPDGQIYMAVNNSSTLGTIQANEDTTKVSTINLSGFTLAGGTNSRLGLPNLIQQNGSGFGGPGFTFTGICLGDTTKFVGTPTDAIDKFQWFFGDGGGSTQAAPKHLYASAGTYTVSMRLTNRCGLDTTIIQKVKINPPPAKPSIPLAAVLCNGPVTLDANAPNTTGLTYSWSTGAVTKTISVALPAIINVTNTDTNGCTSKAQSMVVDNRPQVNLGADQTVCQNTTLSSLDAQNPGANYVWTINGVAASTTEFQSVSTATVGVFAYKVVVTNPVTNCTVTAQKNITVNVSPTYTFTKIADPSTCGAKDGKVTLTISTSTPPSGPYTYSISGPASFTPQYVTDASAPKTVNLTTLGAGSYSATVQDQISGCSVSQSVGLVDASFTSSATFTNCNPSLVTVTNSAGTAPFIYTFTDASSGKIIAGPQTTNSATLPAGNYSIQVVDKNGTGCTFTFAKNVNPVVPTISINPSLCSNPATLNAALSSGSATSYSWSSVPSSAISGGASGATVNINAGGTFTVAIVTGSCTLTQSATINYKGALVPDFVVPSPCQTSVTLSATPVGSYLYKWLDGTGATIGTVPVISVSSSGQYKLSIQDATTGCPPVLSASKQVDVLGILTASLGATVACDDGSPFTLTATTNATSPTYAWALNGKTIAGATTNPLAQTNAGTYQVTVSENTCSAVASIEIVKAPIPMGQLPAAATICNDPDNADPSTKTIELDPGVFVSYNWFKNDVALNYTSEKYTANSEGVYRVDLTNTYSCTNSNVINVINSCEPLVTAPNAFRPGSHDSKNKDFYVFPFYITDNFEVVIFNRWGEPVFESKDVNFKWNGGYNNNLGQPLPGGTYAYVIRFVSKYHPDRGVQEQRGGVVLLR